MMFTNEETLRWATVLRDGDRVADIKIRQQIRLAADAIEELMDFVNETDCQCFDEHGKKLRYSDLEGVPCDCDRCELVKQKWKTLKKQM